MGGYSFAQLRKFWVAVVGFAVTLLATLLAVGPELIPESWLPWIQVFLAVAGSYGVFRVSNAEAEST